MGSVKDSQVQIQTCAKPDGVIAMVFHLLIDESPVPEPPAPGEGGIPLVPAGVGITMAAVGIASALSVAAAPPADAADGTRPQAVAGFCALPPPVVDRGA